MNVEQVMTVDVKTCTLHDTLDDAARVMWDGDCGSVPIVDDEGKVVGMITDRDACISAWIQGRPMTELRVANAMSDRIHTCGPKDSLERARSMMMEHRVRRLPVVGSDGRLLGILSLNDLALAAVNHPRRASEWISIREVGETLAAVCRPRADAAPHATPHATHHAAQRGAASSARAHAKPRHELGAAG